MNTSSWELSVTWSCSTHTFPLRSLFTFWCILYKIKTIHHPPSLTNAVKFRSTTAYSLCLLGLKPSSDWQSQLRYAELLYWFSPRSTPYLLCFEGLIRFPGVVDVCPPLPFDKVLHLHLLWVTGVKVWVGITILLHLIYVCLHPHRCKVWQRWDDIIIDNTTSCLIRYTSAALCITKPQYSIMDYKNGSKWSVRGWFPFPIMKERKTYLPFCLYDDQGFFL